MSFERHYANPSNNNNNQKGASSFLFQVTWTVSCSEFQLHDIFIWMLTMSAQLASGDGVIFFFYFFFFDFTLNSTRNPIKQQQRNTGVAAKSSSENSLGMAESIAAGPHAPASTHTGVFLLAFRLDYTNASTKDPVNRLNERRAVSLMVRKYTISIIIAKRETNMASSERSRGNQTTMLLVIIVIIVRYLY